MQRCIIFMFILFFFFSCREVKETIINLETKEKMIGFEKDCRYKIGETNRAIIGDSLIEKLENDSLYLGFSYVSNNLKSNVLLSGWGAGKYGTSRGLKIGDFTEKAVQLYGKPVATDLEYWNDEEHGIKWSFEGLFYKNMAILIDTASNTVIGVSVGHQFEIDKKYRRKSHWFRN